MSQTDPGSPRHSMSWAATAAFSVVAAVGALGCSRTAEAIRVEEAGYSVQMPGPTTVREEQLELGFARFHSTKAGDLAYVVGYSDNLGVDVTADEMLGAVQSGYVGEDTLVRQESIELAGVSGREVAIQGRGITRVVRLYAAGRRTYHLSVLTKSSELPRAEVDRFFGTFRITQE